MLQRLILGEKMEDGLKTIKKLSIMNTIFTLCIFIKWKNQKTHKLKNKTVVTQPLKKNPQNKIKIKVRASVCLEETIQFQRYRIQQEYSIPIPIQP